MVENPLVEVAVTEFTALQRDAHRYRYLRDEENWGEDSGEDSWEVLGESSGAAFDYIVDSRMAKAEGVDPSQTPD